MVKILVVDDEEILRMLIRDTLEDMGYEIDEAEDGQDALQKLARESYDVMLLDYMMPNLTGIEVIERLPQQIKEQLTIIMLTAKSQESDKQRVLDKGVDYFMSKPFSPMKLAELVEEALHAE
ncbi:response regulator [Metasolibacillus meyeri]|uniref:Response regulator n=1 Tax=Metasolibacillus meyeri TaxID=1071052 RepID=A0AAW9NRL4_9BACL|nr:response regulator [Metasolibacillus meyeri]MEC1178977.1 response regulator [Metasolibacillus meyeri]